MARKMVVLIAIVMMTISFSILAGAPQAWACSCLDEEFSAQGRDDGVTFVGLAVERKEQQQDPDVVASDDPVIWTFLVDRVYKGSAQPQQDVVSALAEISCGYEFELGRSYVVQAWSPPDVGAGRLVTNLCSETRLVEQAPIPGFLIPARQPERANSKEGATSVGNLAAVGLAVAVGGAVTALALGILVLRHRRRSSS